MSCAGRTEKDRGEPQYNSGCYGREDSHPERRRGHLGETALHWAALLGEYRLAGRLIGGSDIDLKDEKYNSSPLGWAVHGRYNPPAGNQGKQCEVAALLVSAGATVEPEWLESEQVRADTAMLDVLRAGTL